MQLSYGLLARWRCEHCDHPHDPEDGYTLTVHHLDGDPANCDWENLVALCQRCHLRWQNTWQPRQSVMAFARPEWMVKRGLGERSVQFSFGTALNVPSVMDE